VAAQQFKLHQNCASKSCTLWIVTSINTQDIVKSYTCTSSFQCVGYSSSWWPVQLGILYNKCQLCYWWAFNTSKLVLYTFSPLVGGFTHCITTLLCVDVVRCISQCTWKPCSCISQFLTNCCPILAYNTWGRNPWISWAEVIRLLIKHICSLQQSLHDLTNSNRNCMDTGIRHSQAKVYILSRKAEQWRFAIDPNILVNVLLLWQSVHNLGKVGPEM